MFTEPKITSRRNPLIQEIQDLQTASGQKATPGLCWVEGAVCAESALQFPERVRGIILADNATAKCCQLAEKLASRQMPVTLMTPECFQKCSVLKQPEGLGLVVASLPTLRCEQLPDNQPIACLWQLQDPGNLGTIMRSAAAFGCHHLLLVTPGVFPLHPQTVRASAGTALQMHFAYANDLEALAYLRKQGMRVRALSGEGLELKKDNCYNDVSTIVVSGNEPHGLPNEVRQSLPLVAIPIKPAVESLNVTAASAIAYYIFWSAK